MKSIPWNRFNQVMTWGENNESFANFLAKHACLQKYISSVSEAME